MLKQRDKPEEDVKDLLESTIGSFGRWQLKISLFMALLKFPMAWFQMNIVFLAPPTQFWCSPTGDYVNYTIDNWLEVVRPNINKSKTDSLNEGFCQIKNYLNGSQSLISCPGEYTYNRTIFRTSIITEWDLICEDENYVHVTQIILMCGVLLGNIIFGVLADKYGRKSILLLCIVIQAVFGVIASWSPWFWLFTLSRFLLALGNGGTMVTSFVMCMEIVGGKWRTIVPILYQIPFGLGYSSLSALAYFLRDWRQFHFVLALISGLFIVYFWLIPESPRWLAAIGKREKAFKIIMEAATVNKINPNHIQISLTNISNRPAALPEKPKMTSLCSTPILTKRILLLCSTWLIGGMGFFGFSQYVGHVSKNIFITVIMGGLVTLPGTLFCVYVVGRFGRKLTIILSSLLTAGCFLAILMVPKGAFSYDWPRIAFAGIGIVGMALYLPALFLFTGELFPTTLRNAGVGATTMFSRIGSMIAPVIIALHNVSPFLPLITLSVLNLLQVLLVLPLPETKDKSLPENVKDIEMSELDTKDDNLKIYIKVPYQNEEENF